MKYSLSALSIYITLVVYLVIAVNLGNYKKDNRVIEHDVNYYYGYLPALFIYDDIAAEKSTYQVSNEQFFLWHIPFQDGGYGFKMTYGTSVLYAPFFFGGHLVASYFDYPANGFSEPYRLFLVLGTIFFSIAALLLVRKILSAIGFSERVTAITILLIGLSTNLLCFSTELAPMPHAYSFFLFAAFVRCLQLLRQTSKIKWMWVLGLVFGLITVIRPTNGLIILIYFLYDIRSLEELKRVKIRYKELAIFFFTGFILWLPQFLYWHKVSGHYLVDSYPGESFFFSNPKIYRGLFGFRKGWLIYTPVMFFALFGLFRRKTISKFWLSLMIFLPVNFYIIVSWWCWWYGGGMGLRPMIESYALLSIPLAAAVEFIVEKRSLFIASVSLWCFFTWLNIFQTYQYEKGSLDFERMNGKLYFLQFGKLEKVPEFDANLSYVNAEDARRGER